MKDFAYWLRLNRERAGLNQAQLAAEISQSSSYVSMLESRRKPPPSDEVVRRIARALDIDEERLLEVAHIERTPPDIQRKVLDLSQQVELGQKTRKTLLDRLLPAALYPVFAGGGADISSLPVPKATQTLLARVAKTLEGISDFELFSEMAVHLFDELSEDDRETLLTLIGDLVTQSAHAPSTSGRRPAVAEGRIPLFLEIPETPVDQSLEDASGFQDVAPADAGPGRYGIQIHGNDLYPRIEHGDLVVIDESREPANGDLVAVLHEGTGTLMRYLALASHVELSPLTPQRPPLELHEHTPPEEIALRGVVVRVVRNLG